MASLSQIKAQKEVINKVNEVDLTEIGLGVVKYSLTTEMLEEQRTREMELETQMINEMKKELRKKGVNVKDKNKVLELMIDKLGNELTEEMRLEKNKKAHEVFFYSLDDRLNKEEVYAFYEKELGEFAQQGYEIFLNNVYLEYIELIRDFNTPISNR
jgi:hypothetical protein